MKKSITQNQQTNNERGEELKEAFVLWNHTSKGNTNYLSGKAIDPKGVSDFNVIGFFNTNKKNPKEPDVRIYSLTDEGKQDSEVADLWESVSKNEKRYLTGSTNEKEKLIAFYGNNNEEKRPYIRAYYKNN